MEKRAIFAAVLIAGLLVVYQLLFVREPPPPSPTAEKPAESPREVKTTPPVSPATPPPLRAAPPVPVQHQVATVDTPLYRARITSAGGALTEWTLNYRGNKPMIIPDALASKGLVLGRRDAGKEPVSFRMDDRQLVAKGERASVELPLEGVDPYGIQVTEALRFDAHDYRVNLRVKLENKHSVAQNVEVHVPWFSAVKWPEGKGEDFQGQRPTRVIRLGATGVERTELQKVGDSDTEGKWIGLESELYITALLPRNPGFNLVTSKSAGSDIEIGVKAAVPLAPGQKWEAEVLIYLGPKEHDRLKALGVGLEEAIDFGGFPVPRHYGGLPMAWLAVPILWLMNLTYRYIPNYGVAIILLTLVTKVILYPLSLKSMASMKAMQAIQPQVNALRAKYKADPQRIQRETLELYRKHKINPMGGCLPMVVQIPIFYALYLVFSLSVELQNAEFLCFGTAFGARLWICDLAQHDPTYVLPILMGISMFVQQKMTPTVGDPRQAKIMLLMPVVFTFMFLNLPSGLVLYWFVSNVLQVLQQYYLDRRLKLARAGKEGS